MVVLATEAFRATNSKVFQLSWQLLQAAEHFLHSMHRRYECDHLRHEEDVPEREMGRLPTFAKLIENQEGKYNQSNYEQALCEGNRDKFDRATHILSEVNPSGKLLKYTVNR